MQLSYSIQEVSSIIGLGKTKIYAAIKSGELVAKKFGKRTLILRQDLDAFLHALPSTKNHKIGGQYV